MSDREPPDSDGVRLKRAERGALAAATHYAEVHGLGTPLERPYLETLPAARGDILHRFVRGLLRGAPLDLPTPTMAAPRESIAAALPFETAAAVPTGGRERVAALSLPASERALTVPVAAVGGYERLRTADPVSLVDPAAAVPVTHPADLVAPLEREGVIPDAEQAGVVETELEESVANLALAHLAERVQGTRASAPVVETSPTAAPAADRPAYLERLVTRGHPFHPGAKIRRGMSPTDGLAYAPEFAETIHLRFVAVRRTVARRTSAGGAPFDERLYAAFDGLEAATAASLPGDRAIEEYVVVPVHPWQHFHVFPERYADQRSDGQVVPVADYARPATPLLNLRTVVPYPADGDGGDSLPHCKLAIGVQATNVERTVSPQAVHNGPRMTRLWRAIDDRESFDTLGALAEPAAASYYPPGGPHTSGEGYDDARHLAGLLRSNPAGHPLVTGDARPVPAASLAAASPRSGQPIAGEIVDRFPGADGADAARAFLDAYVEAIVPPHLRLLSAYGVALESHLQNCYVVLDGWRPVAALVRDFGGVRIHADRLADRGLSFEPYPDSDLDAADAAELHGKLYYALFQNHLAELVAALVRTTPIEAATCWESVRRTVRETFDRLRTDGAVPEARLDDDEAALLEDPIPFKSLTAMRLRGKRHEYVTGRVSNPLADSPGRYSWE